MNDAESAAASDAHAGSSDIDPRPLQRRWTIWRTLAFAVLAIWAAYIVATMIDPAPASWTALLRLAGWTLLFLLLAMIAMIVADVWEDKTHSALLLNAVHAALKSESKYILLLRSFHSKLVRETTHTVRIVEREELRIVRGDVYPTGRTYKAYEEGHKLTDDVAHFLVSAGLPVIFIDGKPESLSANPLSILSDDASWREIFNGLKAGARLVAVVPEDSPSLGEEIAALVQSADLRNCVFLMPSTVKDSGKESSDQWISGRTRAQSWPAPAALALPLPDYTDEGGLLVPAEVPGQLQRLPYTRQALKRLLDGREAAGLPLAQAVDALRRRNLLELTLAEMERRRRQILP